MRNPASRLHRTRPLLASICLLWIGLAVACTSPASTPTVISLPPPPVMPSSSASATPAATITATAPPSSAVSATPAPQVCAPFPDYTLAELNTAVSNPFNPPPPGSDDPHQGVDIAMLQPGSRIALDGGSVAAVLTGEVVMVVADRYPYGNAVLIETRRHELPTGIFSPFPTAAPTLPPHPALTCPQTAPQTGDGVGERSLYLLYAHMQAPPLVQPGQQVSCGEVIGRVGQSGNALHPHLHLEARIGQAGWRFTGMAHYETRASAEEMSNYCLWRVSNQFQLVNPNETLALLP